MSLRQVGDSRASDVVLQQGCPSVGARTTSDTLESHGKIAGGFSREVHESYTNLVESDVKQFSEKKEFRREEDLNAISRRDEIVALKSSMSTLDIPEDNDDNAAAAAAGGDDDKDDDDDYVDDGDDDDLLK
ncbi:hypothetical protein DPMN_067701 [Dreissena polymorpha]|uniref:Uncharacterized protein n=1 Tax=Dreissena polymorpha TaxID=45954 RepID=A0A9D3Z169_DREPO|nr:hypothetical protein DPMN_067701 [Dreissena polymorpha]